MWWAAFSPDGRQIATNSQDGDIRLWSADLTKSAEELAITGQGLQALYISSDQSRILTAGLDNKSTLWQVSPWRPIRTVSGGFFGDTQISSNGRVAVADVQVDGGKATVTVLNALDGRTLNTFIIPNLEAGLVYHDLEISPDGQLIALIGYDQTAVHLYDALTGVEVYKIDTKLSALPDAGWFSADSKSLFIGFDNGLTRQWTIADGTLGQDYFVTTDQTAIQNIQLSTDGKRLLVAHSNGSVDVFDSVSGHSIQRLEGSNFAVIARFSPDGNFIVTSGSDSTLHIWNVQTGKIERDLVGHSANSYADYSPDRKFIYSVGLEGQIRRWFVDYHDLIADTCARVFRDLSPAERATYGIKDDTPTCPTSSATPTPIPATVTAMLTPTATP